MLLQKQTHKQESIIHRITDMPVNLVQPLHLCGFSHAWQAWFFTPVVEKNFVFINNKKKKQ